jgi:Cell wall hydrolyses involved in spore germination
MKLISYLVIMQKNIRGFFVLCSMLGLIFVVTKQANFKTDYMNFNSETHDNVTENELVVSISSLEVPVSKTANTLFNNDLLKEYIKLQMSGVLNNITSPSPVEQTPRIIQLSDEDILLIAACVQMEAGPTSYEGQVAVTNVILNRLESGRWGNTVNDVIYAKNQFPGATNGKLSRILDNGVNEQIFKAIDDAMLGYNNIGDFMFFNAASAVNVNNYKSTIIIGGNCFYSN